MKHVKADEYTRQASKFLNDTKVNMIVAFVKNGKHFVGDTDYRDIYQITLKRNGERFSFRFGQSINDSGKYKPSSYDVLTCLQKYDVGSLEDFCSEFGYESWVHESGVIYRAVCKEYEGVCRIWTDEEIEQLQEIQ